MRSVGGLAILVCVLAGSGCAHVRTTQNWTDLATRLQVGSRVAVTDDSGTEWRGRVSAISSAGVEIDQRGSRRELPTNAVREVRRDGDPIWNGLLIGAGTGVLLAALPDSYCNAHDGHCNDSQIGGRVLVFSLSTAAGALIDAAHKDRSVLYRRPGAVRIDPVIAPRAAGVVVSVRF